MPLGGASVLWDENSPPDSELAGLGDDRIRSVKTSARAGLDSEHNWPSTGGADTGYHRMGSARPFYDTQSRVSSSGTDARLLLTSDTSRLFAVGSGGTVFLGDPRLISVASAIIGLAQADGGFGVPQRQYWAVEFSRTTGDLESKHNVTFPHGGFNGVPLVWAKSHETETSTLTKPTVAHVVQVLSTGVEIRCMNVWSQDSAFYRYVDVISVGTRTF